MHMSLFFWIFNQVLESFPFVYELNKSERPKESDDIIS